MPRHRESYESSGLLREILELLGTVFPFFQEQEAAARRRGLRWERCSSPFVYRERGRVVSHVGLLEMPLVVNGSDAMAGAVHGVATHPQFRRRGFYRSVMEELLEWCEGRYETLQLTTDNPEYFEPFGFRLVDEHYFTARRSFTEPHFRTEPLEDGELLRSLLARRDPVSHRLGVRDRHVFVFNEARRPLRYARHLNAVLSYDVDAETLKLWDVVAPELPSLSEIANCVDEDFERIEVHFVPDRLEASLEPVRESRDGDVLMVRGPYPAEEHPIKLPTTARC